jgi:aminoglycoside phosphotransferase (APT) family kinase protein
VNYSADAVRAAFDGACPGVRVRDVRPLDVGYSSKQWLFDTDEGPLMLKVPVRNPDPHKLRNMIAATRVAAELGIPVSRYRAFLPHHDAVGAPVLVQEFLAGEQATRAWADLEPADRTAVAATLGDWVGLLHTRTGAALTDVLGDGRRESVEADVLAQLDKAAAQLAEVGDIGVDLAEVRRRIERGAAEFGEVEPTLCHRDVYLDNLLLNGRRAARLLDFEHARFADRYAEFGKIRELLFDHHPETERPFLDAYEDRHPIDDAGRHRLDVHIGLYNVVMCGYFSKWTPDLVPVYVERIKGWLSA